MIAPLIWLVAGAIGGLIRAIITGKGIVLLPRIHVITGGSRHLNLGIVAPILIGAAAGFLTSNSLGVDGVVAFIAGYAGSDMLENLVERNMHKPKS